ncbi:sushi, von Willebrand factor type A, EGF and pentraxin domain-containing protein 1-like isoform X2 [Amblyomma americanum]
MRAVLDAEVRVMKPEPETKVFAGLLILLTSLLCDVEEPMATFCPDDIVVYHKTPTVNVSWEEPTFVDNGPGEVKVVADTEPGSAFIWGPPTTVTYRATDAAGNTAICSFKVVVRSGPLRDGGRHLRPSVNVQEAPPGKTVAEGLRRTGSCVLSRRHCYPPREPDIESDLEGTNVSAYSCSYIAPPKNGCVACDLKTDRQFCSVYCDKGYDFVFKPEPLYRCKQTPEGGQWSTFSRRRIRFPWPDCATPSRSRNTGSTIDLTFATNSCITTHERKAELRKKVSRDCDPEAGPISRLLRSLSGLLVGQRDPRLRGYKTLAKKIPAFTAGTSETAPTPSGGRPPLVLSFLFKRPLSHLALNFPLQPPRRLKGNSLKKECFLSFYTEDLFNASGLLSVIYVFRRIPQLRRSHSLYSALAWDNCGS